MSLNGTAIDELEFLLSNYFPKGWAINRLGITCDEIAVTVVGVDYKHLHRVLELLPEALEDIPDVDRVQREAYSEGEQDAENSFEAERIELEEQIEDLRAEVKRLEAELESARLKIHVSNQDED